MFEIPIATPIAQPSLTRWSAIVQDSQPSNGQHMHNRRSLWHSQHTGPQDSKVDSISSSTVQKTCLCSKSPVPAAAFSCSDHLPAIRPIIATCPSRIPLPHKLLTQRPMGRLGCQAGTRIPLPPQLSKSGPVGDMLRGSSAIQVRLAIVEFMPL